ncbi:hypothetical protein LTS18_006769, partial [Coniosporium uncinatum]
LDGKDLDELAELEDEEDEAFLEEYRKKRIAEMSTITNASVFNQVYPLQKPDYSRDVTEASKKAYVLVLLTSSSELNVESRVLIEHWRELAKKYGDVKFCQIKADMCIEGYPDKNTPTVLVYKDGDIQRQIVTLNQMKGPKTSTEDVEQLLVSVGAVRQNDPRVQRRPDEDDQPVSSIKSSNKSINDEDDEDWD